MATKVGVTDENGNVHIVIGDAKPVIKVKNFLRNLMAPYVTINLEDFDPAKHERFDPNERIAGVDTDPVRMPDFESMDKDALVAWAAARNVKLSKRATEDRLREECAKIFEGK